MNLGRGTIVWHEAPFKASQSDGSPPNRPWLIVSNDNHPFQGSEYIVLGMTTNPRSEGIRVQDDDWVDGGTSKTSFISPWFAMTLKHADISYRIGTLQEPVVTAAVTDLTDRLGPRS